MQDNPFPYRRWTSGPSSEDGIVPIFFSGTDCYSEYGRTEDTLKRKFESLAIDNLDDFVFGHAPRPVRLPNGLAIGDGRVHPELNFTLPPLEIRADTMPEVKAQYRQMIQCSCKRAFELQCPALVVEFELLPPLTIFPEWGAEVAAILKETLSSTEAGRGIKTALRVTPNDIREFVRPPRLLAGDHVDSMYRSFELCARAGADFLAIESTGGKEIHDDAILMGDLPLSAFALGILGSRDMATLWDRIVAICLETGSLPAGDSACGFANTAMVLAEQGQVPRVWAATIRVMSVARSLVAFERGAEGPSKDCAYEGVFIKAIAGVPVSLEGAEAACAHLSPIGNIAKCVADLWSNESVQNVMLLGAMAPVVSLEQLVYATRLMNLTLDKGPEDARKLRDWLAESDARLDPQAYVLRPDVAMALARDIIAEATAYRRTRRAAQRALEVLRRAVSLGELRLRKPELRWLDNLSAQADSLPEDEDKFTSQILARLDRTKIRLQDYGLA
jgi:methanol--5-hydroxybenzimidazolylcobamide Co-methyltransferase